MKTIRLKLTNPDNDELVAHEIERYLNDTETNFFSLEFENIRSVNLWTGDETLYTVHLIIPNQFESFDVELLEIEK